MALPPMNVSEEVFVREVDEELQRDQMLSLWQRFGKPALGLIILVLLAWAGWLYWQHRQAKLDGVQGEAFNGIIEDVTANRQQGAEVRLAAIIASDGKGYHAPARMIRANLALQNDQKAKALADYRAVVHDEDAAPPWRDLALIRQTAAEFDTLKPNEVVNRLKPLAVKGNPWFGSAGEMTAMAWIKMGKRDLAARMFSQMSSDETVPESIRSRSRDMATMLGEAVAPATVREGQ